MQIEEILIQLLETRYAGELHLLRDCMEDETCFEERFQDLFSQHIDDCRQYVKEALLDQSVLDEKDRQALEEMFLEYEQDREMMEERIKLEIKLYLLEH